MGHAASLVSSVPTPGLVENPVSGMIQPKPGTEVSARSRKGPAYWKPNRRSGQQMLQTRQQLTSFLLLHQGSLKELEGEGPMQGN